MKKGHSSKTAEQMALSRAIESFKPENERICYDPVAFKFLSKKYSIPLRFKIFRCLIQYFIESFFIGHHFYVIARTRFIDDAIKECANNGIKQLIILGAGFDSRAYRLNCLKNIRVFEIDHPDTQLRKIEKVKELFDEIPGNVVYVPVNFLTDNFIDKLLESGYEKDSKSLFVWEGTTPYLTEPSVDESIQNISKHSCKGSYLIFDYILKSVIDETCVLEGAKREYNYMKKTSEPLTFGIEKENMEIFLKERGFNILKDIDAEYLKNVYFSQQNMNKKVKPWWRIVFAINEM